MQYALVTTVFSIEEGWRKKQRQRPSCLIGGAEFSLAVLAVFASVYMKE